MSRCRSCQQEVIWGTPVRKDGSTGKPMILDAIPCAPREKNARYIVISDTGQRWAYPLKVLAERVAAAESIAYDRAVQLVYFRYPAHRSHFATCPHADSHRRPR